MANLAATFRENSAPLQKPRRTVIEVLQIQNKKRIQGLHLVFLHKPNIDDFEMDLDIKKLF